MWSWENTSLHARRLGDPGVAGPCGDGARRARRARRPHRPLEGHRRPRPDAGLPGDGRHDRRRVRRLSHGTARSDLPARGRPLLAQRLRGIAVDTTALRESRDFRLLEIGGIATGIGTQIGLVALPYQVFVQTRSPFQTGAIGIVELVPLIVSSLVGGALADRMDRR